MQFSQAEIRSALNRVLENASFRRSNRNSDFLRYVVEKKIEGREDEISAMRLADAVFGRGDDFDPLTDPIVRNQATRLRLALERYYYVDGADDPIEIVIPKGTYKPEIRSRPGGAGSGTAATPSAKAATRSLSGEPSIAVLPLVHLGPESNHGYLADGITAELTVELARVQNFLVVAGQSTEAYRGTAVDTRRAGRELGVRYILEGSVRVDGPVVRVTALVGDAETGAQIWADRFEADMTAASLLEIQDRIATEVVAKIASAHGVIPNHLGEGARSKGTQELTAYQAVLLHHQYNSHPQPERYENCKQALERAVETDPEYALAWALLAELCADSYLFEFEDESTLDRAEECARRALRLDPNCQNGHWSLAWTLLLRADPQGCLRAARSAVAANPNAPFLTASSGFLMALAGEWEEGLEILRRGQRLNSNYPNWLHFVPFLDGLRREDYESAVREAVLFDSPYMAWSHIGVASAYGHAGQGAEGGEGRAALQSLLELVPDFPARQRQYIQTLVLDADLADAVLDGLRKSGLEADPAATGA